MLFIYRILMKSYFLQQSKSKSDPLYNINAYSLFILLILSKIYLPVENFLEKRDIM